MRRKAGVAVTMMVPKRRAGVAVRNASAKLLFWQEVTQSGACTRKPVAPAAGTWAR